MCRFCRHGAELKVIQKRVAAEFYDPDVNTLEERRAAILAVDRRLREVKRERKRLHRARASTYAIDYEYDLLRLARWTFGWSDGFLIPGGSGHGVTGPNTSYHEARQQFKR